MTSAPRRLPTRSCVVCRTPRPKRELVRIVRCPDGTLRHDPSGRLSGRGAYLCRQTGCLETAITKGALSRALKTPIPPGLRDELAAESSDPLNMTEGDARGQE
ncbi:MAG: YlxR family protein [Chloroflexi bacterium]|nr:YlxR family protein [Chloroflexota bacterium]